MAAAEPGPGADAPGASRPAGGEHHARPGATIVLAGALIPLILAGGVLFHRAQSRAAAAQAERELDAIARLKVEQIAGWRRDHLEDAEIIQEHGFLTAEADRFLASPSPSPRSGEVLRERLASLARQHDLTEILLLDPSGRARVRALGGEVEWEDLSRPLEAAFADRSPVFIDLHVAEHRLQPHLALVVPIVDGAGRGNRRIGAFLLVIDAAQYLFPLLQSWPTPSQTAETLLVRREGEDVLFLNDLRHVPDTALKLRIPLSRSEHPEVQAALGQEGIFDGRDYRGERVLSVVRRVPDSDWYMVAKIDAAEVFDAWHDQSVLIVAMVVLAALLAAALALAARQREARRRVQARHRLELDQRDALERERTRRMIEEALNEIFVFDARTLRIVEANRAARRNLGYTLEELRALTPVDLKSPMTREELERHLAPLRDGARQQVEFTATHRRKDGSTYPVEVHVQHHAAEPPRYFAFVYDATERVAAEEAARESENLFRQLFERHSAVKLLIDANTGEILEANRAAVEFYGWPREQLVGKRVGEIDALPPAALEEELRRARSEGRIFFEFRHRRADGQVRDVEVYTTRLELKGRPVLHSIVHDVTERKRDQAEVLRLGAALQQAQKMESIGRLAGGVAHDYNNVLGVIQGYVELALRQTRAGDPLRSDLVEIQDAARRATEITRQLLAFARKQTIQPVRLDLNGAIEASLRMLRRLVGEEIEIGWRPASGLWSVRMDPTQVDQILANLCVNARDAIDGPGHVGIRTRNVTLAEGDPARPPELAPGDYVAFEVSDDGAGMGEETLAHVFEPFFTTKGAGKGTGLGLATVYGIVKQNEGHVRVRSAPGSGTTFEFLLPRAAGGAEADALPEEASAPQGRGEVILLVEDEPSLLQVGRRILDDLGYTVLAAGSPEEALRLSAVHPGDIRLLITDVVMPRMNGRELAEALRAARPGLRCLFMSGYTADVIAHRGVLETGIDFVQKPFTIEGLAERTRAALDRP